MSDAGTPNRRSSRRVSERAARWFWRVNVALHTIPSALASVVAVWALGSFIATFFLPYDDPNDNNSLLLLENEYRVLCLGIAVAFAIAATVMARWPAQTYRVGVTDEHRGGVGQTNHSLDDLPTRFW